MNNDERRKTLGEAIREARAIQGISQRELAQMTGASSHSYIAEIEGGNANPTFDTVCKLADALDVSPRYFFAKL